MTPGARGDISAEKAALRSRFRHIRSALDESEYESLSRLIVEEAKRLPELRRAGSVHVYWPNIEEHEVDTRPLIHWLEERGTVVVLPRIRTFEREQGTEPRLAHVRYPGEGELRVNRWGIAEPLPGKDVDPATMDVVVVPALGAGRNGHRIGHGYGYYDEFLASCPALRVGLVFDACLVNVVPWEPHDAPLDVVITERAIIRP